MSTTSETLPLQEIFEPQTQEEVAEIVRRCAAEKTPVYPLGGGVGRHNGLTIKRPGVGLSLKQLNRVIDYPARDMTVTVESGLTMAALAQTLADEGQRLPVDVPQPESATIGGVVASNTNGPRRLGQGNLRDHVIGIRAVDGHGTLFQGGGRVVKNVAGYDFCKLLTGSYGTLGIITQVTFKLKPIPETSVALLIALDDLGHADCVLAGLAESAVTPAAIELLRGRPWADELTLAAVRNDLLADRPVIATLLEGTAREVDWMLNRLKQELATWNVTSSAPLSQEETSRLIDACAQFPGEEAPYVLEASVVSSHTMRVVEAAIAVDDQVKVLAHAGSGIVVLQFPEIPGDGVSRSLIGKLQPVAIAGQGNVVVLANPGGVEATRQSVWGGNEMPLWLMQQVKDQFDPHHILNPDRFIF